MGFGGDMRIIEPERTVEGMMAMLRKIEESYEE
jgi:hypothetical protein